MPQNLNEEIKRMLHLVNFKIDDNSHDVLSEQNIKNVYGPDDTGDDEVTKKKKNDKWTDDYIEAWIYERLLPESGKKVWDKGTEESKANAIANIRNKFETYGEKKTRKEIYPKYIYLINREMIDITKPSVKIDLSFTLTDESFEPFPNNGSQPGEDLIRKIDEKVAQFAADCPNIPLKSMGNITKLEIYTSCSRLRNTLNPNKTWLELAEDRAKNAYKVISQRFGAAGYPVPGTEDSTPDVLIIDWKGDNGNGSSGKDDPYKNGKIVTGGEAKGSDSLKEEYYSIESCKKHNKDSPPCGDNRADLDQYKYIRVIIVGECVTVNPAADVEYTFDLGTHKENVKNKGKNKNKKNRNWCWSNGGLRYCFKWLKGKEKWSTECSKKLERKLNRKKGQLTYKDTNMKNKKTRNKKKKNQYK
jgi:hypothetical protein